MMRLKIFCICALLGWAVSAGAQNVNNAEDKSKTEKIADSVEDTYEKLKDAIDGKVAKADSLIGTWKFSGTAVLSTDRNLLKKAAANTLASSLKKVLENYTEKSGINSSNTHISFNVNGTFLSIMVKSKTNGTWMVGGEKLMLANKNVVIANIITRLENGELLLLTSPKEMLEIFRELGGVPDNDFVEALSSASKLVSGLKCGFSYTK
ncbi:MAG: DUF4923 family protein [Bacteroidaceae bacterium]|nr:DUF4923 family protein [Bacteroidaceae bacterium]